MTRTIKERTLLAIRQQGLVADIKTLRLSADTDLHALTHVLFRLRRDGHATFRLRTRRNTDIPYNIALTPAGEKRAQEIT